MSTPSVKTVFIFDWDGTLLDVSKHILFALESSINKMLSDSSLYATFPFLSDLQPVGESDLRPFLGHRFKENILPALYPEVCQHEELVTLFYQRFLATYSAQKSALFPQVEDLLHRIKQHPDCALALATNKSRSLLLRELNQHNLAALFDRILCGDDASHGGRTKPAPDMLNSIQAGYPQAETCYMIGDSPADILAAKNTTHPTISIAVLNDDCATTAAQIRDSQPDKLLARPVFVSYLQSILPT
jgi:HAD superfamily hydrolase (TIGR01549 family)